MPPRKRTEQTNRRNNSLQIVVNRHSRDPEFLARLMSAGIKGQVRNTARNYLKILRNRAATNVRMRLTKNIGNSVVPTYIFNAPKIGRRNRSLMRHARALPNTNPNQRYALKNIENYINRNIRPHIQQLRISQNRSHYRHPNKPHTMYILGNNGRLISRNMLNYMFASGVRRRGPNRLEY